MQERAILAGVIRFGPFALDRESRELHKGATRLKVPDQSIEILTALLERPGHLVTREELRARLWPADTFVDFDAGLNAAIKRLREALGDTADASRFVETLPRRGYRFIGVLALPAECATVSPVSTVPPPSRTEWLLANSGTLVVVVALVLMSAAAIWMTQRRSIAPAVSFNTAPVTTLPGNEVDPALSPDGNQLAYAWDGDGKDLNIYVKLIGEEGSQQLTTDPAAEGAPSWSPDGRRIAFLRTMSNGVRVVGIVSARGGRERMLLATETGPYDGPQYFNGVSWTPDGKSVLFADRAPGSTSAAAIYACSIETGIRSQLTFPHDFTDAQPAISPDGHYLAFVRRVAAGWLGYVFVQRLDGLRPVGQPQRSTMEPNAAVVAWQDNRSILYDAYAPMPGLWRASIGGGSPEPILLNAGATHPSVGRKGTRVVFQRSMNDSNIWKLPGPANYSAEISAASPIKIIDSTATDNEPQISFDGLAIAFISRRSGSNEAWIAPLDGAAGSLQITNNTRAGSPRWSPDGHSIAFDAVESGSYHIYTVSSQGGAPTAVTHGGSNDVRPSWSKDQRTIYFGSNRTGEWQIWRMAADGTNMVPLTKRGGGEAYESVDGRFLYYAKSNGEPGIWRVRPNGGEETQVIDHGTIGFFGVTAGGIVLMNPLAEPTATIEFFDTASDRLSLLHRLSAGLRFPSGATSLAVSRDGRWIVYSQLDNWGTDIHMLERVDGHGAYD